MKGKRFVGSSLILCSRARSARTTRWCSNSCVASGHPKHLHYFIPQVIDDLDRNPPGFRFVEGPRGIAVERRPGVLVDLGLERGLERLVGIVGAEEVGVADKKLSSL